MTGKPSVTSRGTTLRGAELGKGTDGELHF